MRTPLSVFVGSHLDADIAAVESEIRATDAPTGWLGPLLDGLMAARAVVAAAEDYSPELEAGDNGEWAFDEALVSLAQPYAGERGWDRQWLRSEATR